MHGGLFILVKLGGGFSATSQLADRPKGKIFQCFAALIYGYAIAKYQVWEKGGRPVDF